eukprot:11014402-Alexandrium_andersonii.AAC.1
MGATVPVCMCPRIRHFRSCFGCSRPRAVSNYDVEHLLSAVPHVQEGVRCREESSAWRVAHSVFVACLIAIANDVA